MTLLTRLVRSSYLPSDEQIISSTQAVIKIYEGYALETYDHVCGVHGWVNGVFCLFLDL